MTTITDEEMEIVKKYFYAYLNHNWVLSDYTMVLEGLTTVDVANCKVCAAMVEASKALVHAKWHETLCVLPSSA